MRTNIEIDDDLTAEAMRRSDLPTKEATVEEALGRLIRSKRQLEALEDMRDLGWEGDLDAIRGR